MADLNRKLTVDACLEQLGMIMPAEQLEIRYATKQIATVVPLGAGFIL